MHNHRIPLLTLLAAALVSGTVRAEPASPQAAYVAQARQAAPAFAPDGKRGAAFFSRKFNVSEKMPACVACHTENPAQAGRHAVTGKDILPLALHANPKRFTDPAKTEKWFRRNCTEVVGRECSAAEKADVIQYLTELR